MHGLVERPARSSTARRDINGIDYIDGGVRHTANIDVAIEKGADLIVCYNPFRPFLNRIDSDEGDDSAYFADGRYLSDRGSEGDHQPGLPHPAPLAAQAGHPALPRGRSLHRATSSCSSPASTTPTSSPLNPLAFWKRSEAIQHGFESVRTTIEQNYDQLEEVFESYGLSMDREAARRRAGLAREHYGWRGDEEPEPEPAGEDERPLRVVGGRGR